MNHQVTKTRSGHLEPIPSGVETVAAQVVDAAFAVHSELGAGLLESIYEICLVRELQMRGVQVERQVVVPITYKGAVID